MAKKADDRIEASHSRGGFLRAAGALVATGAAGTALAGLSQGADAAARPTTDGRFIEVEPGVRVFAQDWGVGRPIVFVHGLPVSYLNWEYQITQLAPLGYRCIGIDLRGFGQSDKPYGTYSFDVFADDLKVVLDALDLQGATLVGHSMGGGVALNYAARHGGRIDRLVLAGAATPCLTTKPDFPQGAPRAAFDGQLLGLSIDRPAALAAFGSVFFHKKVSPQFQSWFNSLGLAASPYAHAECLKLLRDADQRPLMGKVRVPTLIVHGAHDPIAPLAITGALLARGIPGARLDTFADSGHGLFIDEKDRFNRTLMRFIG